MTSDNNNEQATSPKYQPPASGFDPANTPPPWVSPSQTGTGQYYPAYKNRNDQPPPNYNYNMYNAPGPAPVQDPLYRKALERVNAKIRFMRHLATYVIINGMLWLIAITSHNWNSHDIWSLIWPIWVTVFWGIGLVSEYFRVYGISEDTRQRMIDEEMRRMRR